MMIAAFISGLTNRLRIFNIPITTREISISLFGGLFGGIVTISLYFIIIKLKNRKTKNK